MWAPFAASSMPPTRVRVGRSTDQERAGSPWLMRAGRSALVLADAQPAAEAAADPAFHSPAGAQTVCQCLRADARCGARVELLGGHVAAARDLGRPGRSPARRWPAGRPCVRCSACAVLRLQPLVDQGAERGVLDGGSCCSVGRTRARGSAAACADARRRSRDLVVEQRRRRPADDPQRGQGGGRGRGGGGGDGRSCAAAWVAGPRREHGQREAGNPTRKAHGRLETSFGDGPTPPCSARSHRSVRRPMWASVRRTRWMSEGPRVRTKVFSRS